MEINFDIKKSTSFKIGGQIARMYFPTSVEEFVDIKTKEPDDIISSLKFFSGLDVELENYLH